MGNIIDYVKTKGEEDFNERPFSTEDALVLAEFVYHKFDRIIPEMSEIPLSLQDLKDHPDFDSMYVVPKYEKDNRALFEAMLSSKRFGELKVCFYINRIDLEDEMQFAAVTFILPGGRAFIAFRGTDETIVGWQEDFKLALEEPVQGQKLSAKYVNDVAQRVNGNIMIGGHSKGGNLAMYAAMNCTEPVKDRISVIYSFDGPGFRPELLQQYGFDAIRDRVVSVIPKSSVIGLMLCVDENSTVVNARSVGVLQHNPYTWVIEEGKLSETHLSEQHLMLIDTFNDWMFSLDEEHLNGFIGLLIELLNATKADTTIEITAETYKYASNLIKAAGDMDEETKEFLNGLLRSFWELMRDKMVTEVSSRLTTTKEEITKMILETRGKLERISEKNKNRM